MGRRPRVDRACVAAILTVALGAACRGKPRDEGKPPPAPEAGLADAPIATDTMSAALAGYPVVDSVRAFGVPAKQDVPRYDVGGPVLDGDLAVVASSQFGFLAVDWRNAQVVWSKPSGPHVAPPLRWGARFALVGDCLAPPKVPAGEILLGCLRVVTRAGADEVYLAIRGSAAALGEFERSSGRQALHGDGDAIRWVRGEHAVTIDPATGIARRATAQPPARVAAWQGTRWEFTRDEAGTVVAMRDGQRAWQRDAEATALLGIVEVAGRPPRVRFASARMDGEQPQLQLHDLDVTGTMVDTSARPLPGIQIYGQAASQDGAVALAIRLDSSLRRDYVAAFASSGQLAWVHALPETPRADPIGVAIASDAVVVFHDGDTFTILPAVSAAPTTGGAGAAPSDSPTP